MRKERNHSFVTAAERISVHAVLDNDVLEEFSKVLTPYALNFVRSQLHEALEVYPGGDNDHPTCEILGSEVLVNELNCHCIFFKSMGLPCKHMFVARRIKQLPIFSFDGISIRWLKSHATENHRLFQHHSENHNYLEIGVNKERTLTQAEKFKKACRLSQRLAQLVSEGGHSEFESRINILQNLVKIWEDYKHAKVTVLESSIDLITNTTSECAMSSKINLNNDVLCDITKKAFIPPTSNIVLTCNETFYQTNMHALEVSKSDNLEKLSDFEKSSHLEQLQLDIEQDNFNKSAEIVAEMSSQPCNKIIHVSNQTSIPIVIENPIEDSEERACGSLHNYFNVHSINIKDLKFPSKIHSRGRPKATQRKTAIGLCKRKRKCLSYTDKSVTEKIRVLLSSILIKGKVQDVTHEMQADVDDLQLNPDNLPSSFINDAVAIDVLKPYLTDVAWNKLNETVSQRKKLSLWCCPICNLTTASRENIECKSCLERFHFKCVSISKKTKKEWFCDKCHNMINESNKNIYIQ